MLAAGGEGDDTRHLVYFCIAKALGAVSTITASLFSEHGQEYRMQEIARITLATTTRSLIDDAIANLTPLQQAS